MSHATFSSAFFDVIIWKMSAREVEMRNVNKCPEQNKMGKPFSFCLPPRQEQMPTCGRPEGLSASRAASPSLSPPSLVMYSLVLLGEKVPSRSRPTIDPPRQWTEGVRAGLRTDYTLGMSLEKFLGHSVRYTFRTRWRLSKIVYSIHSFCTYDFFCLSFKK